MLYQSRQQARAIAPIIVLIVAALVTLVVRLLAAHVQHGIAERRDIGSAVLAVIAAGAIVFGWRAVRAGVIVRSEGVVVRNPFRSIRVTWDQIERFTVEANGPWTIGCVHVRDGKAIKIWGIQGQVRFLFRSSRWATEPIEQLNELLAEHK